MSSKCSDSYKKGSIKWCQNLKNTLGSYQSPINIQTSLSNPVKSKTFPLLVWSYSPKDLKSLVNTGESWRVEVLTTSSEIVGGPLGQHIYRLEQFHCHWGCCDFQGSEHTVNSIAYSGELHLVHWNVTKYRTLNAASSASDGLAVFGVFLKIGKKHDEINKIVELLHLVSHKGDRITLPCLCDPNKLLPCNSSYWTYEGSLTTPPCTESVTWIIFRTPIEVSQEQMNAMRNIQSFKFREKLTCLCADGKVKDNFRSPLPLGNRLVKYSSNLY